MAQLIAAGAPLDHLNNLHWSAVIESIVLGQGGPRHVATWRALVEAGADLTLADREGRMPLALARSPGYAEMIELLERTGARPGKPGASVRRQARTDPARSIAHVPR